MEKRNADVGTICDVCMFYNGQPVAFVELEQSFDNIVTSNVVSFGDIDSDAALQLLTLAHESYQRHVAGQKHESGVSESAEDVSENQKDDDLPF